jgi:hypothetical protein
MSELPEEIDDEILTLMDEMIHSNSPAQYSDQLLKILRVCPGNFDHEDIEDFILWLINEELYLMLDVILTRDISLINGIFDDDCTQIDGNKVSKAAFEMIAANIDDDSERHEFYIMAILFDLSQEDFDDICETAAIQVSIGTIDPQFYKYRTIFDKLFQVQHIPKLLKFLSSSCINKSIFSQAFNYIWKFVDEDNSAAAADYIWNHHFDSLYYLNTCDELKVKNPIHAHIFRDIVGRSMGLVTSIHQDEEEKPVEKICKFFFFKPYDNGIQDLYEDAILAIFNQVLISTEKQNYFLRLPRATKEIFLHSSEDFRNRIVDLVVRATHSIQNSNNYSTFIQEFLELDHPGYNWPIFRGVASQGFNEYENRIWVQKLISTISEGRYLNDRIKKERIEFLRFLIKYDSVEELVSYVSSMVKKGYFLELRLSEDQIYQFCLRWKTDLKVFDIVRLFLPENVKQDFQAAFLEMLTKEDYLYEIWTEHPFYVEDPSFILEVRQILRTKLTLASTEDCPTHHIEVGTLAARYGDLDLLKAGIESFYSDLFLRGFINEASHRRIQITPEVHEKLLEIFLDSMNDSYDRYGDYSVCDSAFIAYIIRHSTDLPQIKDASVKDERFLNEWMAVHLELMIKKNEIDKEKLIKMIKLPKFDALKPRVLEIWGSLNGEIKELICEYWQMYNIYYRSYRDPAFVKKVVKLFKRSDDVSYAFREYAKAQDISMAIVQLTAHWYFVDDFEEEIRTHGYHWMFQTALLCLDS